MPTMIANGYKYNLLKETELAFSWHCPKVSADNLKCPASIVMSKLDPPKFFVANSQHLHKLEIISKTG